MQTEYLKTLRVIGQMGSFSRAATELCVTQSAISQRIKYLEDHYGCQLVDRSGKVLLLTEAGRIVSHRAEQILLIEAKLLNELKQQGDKSRLAICCTPTFGVAYMPQVIEQFMLRATDNIDLKFMFHSFERAVRELQENEFDLAVIEHCEKLEVQGFETVELPRDELVFISAPGLELPDSEVELKALFEQCLIARKPGCTSRMLLELNLAGQGCKVSDFKRSIILDDLRLTLETVIGGGGVAFISRSLAETELKSGLLREHYVPAFEHMRRRTAVIKSERVHDPTIIRFMDCIHRMFPAGQACASVLPVA